MLTQLRALGLDDNTVVLFISDHGDLLGDRGLLLKGGLHYRALTRVPFVWRDAAGQRSALRSADLAQTTDIGVTVLERAGLAPANGAHGQSLLPSIRNTPAPARRTHLVIEEEGQRRDFGLARRVRMRTLLTAQHRLTLYDGETWGECYELAEDPDELRNLWHLPQARGLRAELGLQLARAMLEQADTSPYPEASA